LDEVYVTAGSEGKRCLQHHSGVGGLPMRGRGSYKTVLSSTYNAAAMSLLNIDSIESAGMWKVICFLA
jgi:hypothetical protein